METADIKISEKIVQSCIDEQFPVLAPITKLKDITSGQDNRTFLVNDNFIFRFPKHTEAIDILEKETAFLNYLRPLLNINIPNPIYHGQPSEQYPYPFHGYPLIKGTSACYAGLTPQERVDSIKPLATCLKQLHGIPQEQAITLGAKHYRFDRDEVDEVIDILEERVEDILAKKSCHINTSCFQYEMNIVREMTLPLKDMVLIHGDLFCGHMIFDQGKLNGIIDWGHFGIKNRAVDLSILYAFYPMACHKTFFEIYGDISPQTLQYTRFLGIYTALSSIWSAQLKNDDALMTEGTNAVNRINPELLGD